MPGNANAKQLLSNVMPSTYLQYADHTDRAALPIEINNQTKRKEEIDTS